MERETFIIKGSERLHAVPLSRSVDDVTESVALFRDVLTLISVVAILSSAMLFVPHILYKLIVFGLANVVAVTNHGVPFEGTAVIVGLLVGVTTTVLQLLMRNRSKHRNELLLLLALAALSVIITAVGASAAVFTRAPIHLQIDWTDDSGEPEVTVASSAFRSYVTSILEQQITSHNATPTHAKTAIDSLQTTLKCCGIDSNYHDWLALAGHFPNSCCPTGHCSAANVFPLSCVHEVARTTASTASILIGYGFVFVAIMSLSMLLHVYFLWAAWRDAKRPSLAVLRPVTSDFERQRSASSEEVVLESSTSSLDEIVLKELHDKRLSVGNKTGSGGEEDDDDNRKGQPKFVNNYVG